MHFFAHTSLLGLRTALVGAVLALSASACGSNGLGSSGSGSGSSGSSGSGPDPSPTNLGAQARADLKACSAGVGEGAFDDALEITSDFRQSCHELVVCGGLAFQTSTAVVQLIVDAALGASGEGGLVFDGEGAYVSDASGGLGTNMSVTLHLPRDTSFGKAGDVIPYDLLRIESYFVGAELTAKARIGTDGLSYDVAVKFTDVGPAFELLGVPRTGNELTLDAKAIARALGAIELRAKTHVDDRQGHATFTYDLTSPPTTLGALADGGALAFELDGLRGARADLGQSLETSRWEVTYVGGKIGKLDGTIGFRVGGGALPHAVTFEYPQSNEPIVRFACP